MNDLLEVLKVIIYFAPVFSSAVCTFVLLLSLDSGFMTEGMTLKRILLGYFVLTAFSVAGIFCYNYFPVLFTCINALVLLAMIVIPVLFCDFICYATAKKRISHIHYLIPAAIFCIFLTWSFFIPFNSQLALTIGKGRQIPDLKVYSLFYLSKPLFRSLFGIAYTLFAARYFLRNILQADLKDPHTVKHLKSIGTIFVLAALFQLFSLISVIMPRDSYFTSIWSVATVVTILALHMMYVYYLLGKNIYMPQTAPYVLADKQITVPQSTENQNEKKKQNPTEQRSTKKLNRRDFENHMRTNKPYLNPDYKITDLAAELEVNRTYVSDFINRTYGVNFNVYINNLRLKELNRLKRLVPNKGKTLPMLAEMAGFSNYRTYIRAKAMIEK